ncbi:MAG: GNAT family N-acetyltransferase [Deltaproteobacteria bacterium]|nr:GNAT family N-acetyltransferase [Deltaproteobacteria bacterium]
MLDLYAYLHPDDKALPPQHDLDRIWESICTRSDIHCIVADMNGMLISSCTLAIIPNLTRGARPYGVIENVVTHPEFRCQGHANAVLQYALDITRSTKCYKVMLLSNKKNKEAHQLYEKMGFDMDSKYGFIIYR